MLKVALGRSQETADRMNLAAPLTASRGGTTSYWYGPDCWYLASETENADGLIAECAGKLADILHNAVDYSASLAGFRVSGDGSRDVLASGTSIDLRPSKFPMDACYRTKLAGILAMITATGEDEYEVLVEHSYANYLDDWLRDTAGLLDR